MTLGGFVKSSLRLPFRFEEEQHNVWYYLPSMGAVTCPKMPSHCLWNRCFCARGLATGTTAILGFPIEHRQFNLFWGEKDKTKQHS